MSSAHVPSKHGASKHPAVGRWLAAGCLAASALALAACGTAPAPELASPAQVVPVAGSSIPRLELTHGAVQRLGLQTRPVAAAAPGTAGATKVIPYAAVVYDADGASWVFVRTEPLTYQRAEVSVGHKSGDQVALAAGPSAGTEVVTVGAAELVGVETGIDGEE